MVNNMALLDKIIQMQNQRIPENEIIKKLRDEGVSPSEINDSLNQARIKTAVSGTSSSLEEMEQSIMSNNQNLPQEVPQAEQLPQQSQPQYPQNQQEYSYPEVNQTYSNQYSYSPIQADSSTISEIAEQIVSEKIQDFEERIGNISVFKSDTEEKMKEFDERLKRIENAIQSLQNAIIKKIGEFDETSSFIHKDLNNIHDTMSKLMNPLIDNYRELKKITDKK